MTETPPETTGTWLDPAAATALLGDVAAGLEPVPWDEALAAVRSWVEQHRPGLWTVGTETEPSVFEPTPEVRFGASLLALRWYARRRAPLNDVDLAGVDVVAEDPDLARMLGVGPRGVFVFGAPTVVEV